MDSHCRSAGAQVGDDACDRPKSYNQGEGCGGQAWPWRSVTICCSACAAEPASAVGAVQPNLGLSG